MSSSSSSRPATSGPVPRKELICPKDKPVGDPMVDLQLKLSELHRIVTQTDALNDRRDELKPEIIKLIKDNGLEESQFSIGDRLIRYKVNNTRSLTNTYLYQGLKAYFKEDLQKADQVYQYIIDNRPQRDSETLEILHKKTE